VEIQHKQSCKSLSGGFDGQLMEQRPIYRAHSVVLDITLKGHMGIRRFISIALCACAPLFANAQLQAPAVLMQQVEMLSTRLTPPDTLNEDRALRRVVRAKGSPYWVAILLMQYVGGNGAETHVGVFREEKSERAGLTYTLLGVERVPDWIEIGKLPKVAMRRAKYEVIEIEAYIGAQADDPREHGKPMKLRYRLPTLDRGGITLE
jgi:hypothetical protein